MNPIGAIASATIASVQADSFIKMAEAKMAAGNAQKMAGNQNNLKNTSIFQM